MRAVLILIGLIVASITTVSLVVFRSTSHDPIVSSIPQFNPTVSTSAGRTPKKANESKAPRVISQVNLSSDDRPSDTPIGLELLRGGDSRLGQINSNGTSANAATAPGVRPVNINLSPDDSTLLKAAGEPPLEVERRNAAATTELSTDVAIDTAFDGGTGVQVLDRSPTHILIQIPNRRFFFKIKNVKNKIVRIDLRRDVRTEALAATVNPVFCQIDLPASRATDMKPPQGTIRRGWNGVPLPPVNANGWDFFENVWIPKPSLISIVHRFEANEAYVAMRVPRMPDDDHRFLNSIRSKPGVYITKIGQSRSGQPLSVVEVYGDEKRAESEKPTILVYAGEHADEPDGMWAAEGMLEHLTSGDTTATALRSKAHFLFVCCLDPDATAAGVHSGIISSFRPQQPGPENECYATWFSRHITSKSPIDIVINLHDGGFKTPGHLACALTEGAGDRGKIAASIHKEIVSTVKSAGYAINERPWQRGYSPSRFGGWLSANYGAITFAYELDSQCSTRHLSVRELKDIGVNLLTSCVGEVSRQKVRIRAAVHSVLDQRDRDLKLLPPHENDESVIAYTARGGASRLSKFGTANKIVP